MEGASAATLFYTHLVDLPLLVDLSQRERDHQPASPTRDPTPSSLGSQRLLAKGRQLPRDVTCCQGSAAGVDAGDADYLSLGPPATGRPARSSIGPRCPRPPGWSKVETAIGITYEQGLDRGY